MKRFFLLLIFSCAVGVAEAATINITFNVIGTATFNDWAIQKDGVNAIGGGTGIPSTISASGSPYHGSATVSNPGVYRLRYMDQATFIWYLSDESYTFNGTTPTSWTFTARGSAPPPATIYKLDAKVCNKTKVPQRYGVYFGTQFQGWSPIVPPGTCHEIHIETDTKFEITFKRESIDPSGQPYNPFTSPTIPTDDSLWYTGETSPGTRTRNDDKTGVVTAPGDTPTINFDDEATNPATEDSLRRVGDAVYDATSQTAVAVGTSGLEISGKLTALQNEVHNGFVNVNGNLVSINAAVAALGTSLGAKLDTVNGNLDGLGTKLNAANGSLGSIGAKLDTANGKLTSIDGTLVEIKDGIDLWRADTGIIIDKIGDLNETAEGLALESTQGLAKSEAHTDAENIRARVAEVKDAVNTADVNSGSRDQARLNKLGDLGGKLDLVTQNTAATAANVDEMAGQNHTDLEAVQNALNGVYNAVNGVGNTLSGFKSEAHSDAESTNQKLDGATNLLDKILAKLPSFLPAGSVNAEAEGAAGLAWGESHGGNALAADGAASVRGFEAIGPGANFFSFTIGGHVVDAHPMHAPYVAQIAAWVRYVVGWLAAFLTIYLVYDAVFKSVLASGSWQPTKGMTEQTPIVGTVTTLFTAGGYRLVIGAAVGAIIVFWTTWKTVNISIWELWRTGQPFGSGFGAVVTAAIALLDQVAPITTILTDMGIVLGARITLGAVNFIRQMAVRWLPS